jgi:predicted ATPase/DNA-binding CsgD family transcriptional regulator
MDTELKTRHNLPSQPTSFIGRGNEIAEIAALLNSPACRLLTLVGPGGSGKTRLAIETAHRARLVDGAFFIPLQPLRSTDDIVTTIVDVLPLQLHGSADPQQQLLDYLRERQMLLILDNFEHLLDGVNIVTGILDAAPHVKLLVTSREALNLQAEHLWPLHGLDTPPDDALEVFDDYSAVQLFVERTRRVKPDFSPAAHKHEVVRICRLVDGLPLALELAAGWMRALSPQAIGDEIQRSIDFLATHQRDLPERHRSMRAVFDRSWRLLSEVEQATFRKLSVFRGGFTLEAAGQVAGASLPLLASLIDKSLLRLDASGRYDLHELVRQYAQGQLEAGGETEAILDAHCTYYSRFVHELEEAHRDHRQAAAFHTIDLDFENIRAAWQRSAQQADEAAVSRMLRTLNNFLMVRGRWVEFLALLEQALSGLAPPDGTMPSLIWGQLLLRKHYEMRFEYTHNDIIQAYDLLRSELQQALEIFLHHGDQREISFCLSILGDLEAYVSHYEAAAQLNEKSLNIQDELGDVINCALGRLKHATILRCSGRDPAICHELVKQALELAGSSGNPLPIVLALQSNAWNHFIDEGDFTTADLAYDEVLALGAQMDHAEGITYGWRKGLIAFLSGEIEEARVIGEKAAAFGTEHHHPAIIAQGHSLLGLIDCLQENYPRSKQRCLTAHQQMLDGRVRLDHFFCSLGLALAGCGLSQVHAVREHLLSALQTAIDMHVPVYKLLCLPCAAVFLAWENQYTQAIELLALAYTHPKSPTGWMKQWPLLARLQERLEAEIGEAMYAAAWERGKSLDLNQSARHLLALLAGAQPGTITNQALPDPLTERELEILRLMAEGYTNREIADRLVLALSTVKWYIKQIYSKLAVDNRTRAAARARELKLLV